jgi:hypothetical protein
MVNSVARKISRNLEVFNGQRIKEATAKDAKKKSKGCKGKKIIY